MRRWFAAMVLSLFLASGAVAEEALPQLTFSWWGDEAVSQAMQEAVSLFEKERKVTIQATGYAERAEFVLASGLSAGQPDDVVLLNMEMLRMYALDENHVQRFMDVEQYLEVLDLTQFSNLGLQSGTVDGRLCAVPVSMTSHVLIWNQTAFKGLHLTIPDTTEELVTVAAALRGTDVYPLAADATGRAAMLVTYLQSRYGHSWVDERTKQCGFSVEQIAEGLRYLQKLESARVLAPLSTQGDLLDGWQDGLYLGIWTWDTMAPELRDALDQGSKLKYAALLTDWGPYDGGFQKAGYLLAVAESSSNQKLGASLVEYLLNSARGSRTVKDLLGTPNSQAGYQYCKGYGLLQSVQTEANKEALSWARRVMPLGFEAQLFIEEGGIYEQVLVGLSEGILTPETAAIAVISGISAVLD